MDTNYKKEKEKMNIQIALDLLDINTNTDTIINSLTKEYVKRKYHKMALRFHPDKNGNTIDATHRFQKINEAYTFLINELELDLDLDLDKEKNDDDINNINNNNMYNTILSVFLSSILRVDSKVMSELLIKIIKDIVINGYKVISLKLIDDLDKERSLELYNFLNKYKHVLYIDTETLELVSSLIKEKYKNDSVYILNPSIDDLLDNNIYKLYVEDQLYLVPLWHNELYFEDLNKNDIIVLCNPELPENVTIDEHNNIHCNLLVPFEKEMIFLKNINTDKHIPLQLGKKQFNIPLNNLFLKEEQYYTLKGQGLTKIIDNDVYNQNNCCKSDIIVKIKFC